MYHLPKLKTFTPINKFKIRQTLLKFPTLESGINVAPGKFGKKNKRSPIYTLHILLR